MRPITFHAQMVADTERLGAALADALPDDTVVALVGPLGAGKTRLVQAIARSSGVAERDVVSPTFVLVAQYEGRRPIYHVDAYRLRGELEFLALGPEEFFDGGGLTLIEWADRIEGSLPADCLRIEIEVTGRTSRTFKLDSAAERHTALLGQLRRALHCEP